MIDNSKQDCIMGLKKLLIQNSLDYFAKTVVAEEIGQGNEISKKIGLSKIGLGNELSL